jgi:hypothetical protein
MNTNATGFRSAPGKPLCFTLFILLFLSLAPPNLLGADISRCFVRKMQGFSQTSTNPPQWRTPSPFTFQADAYADSSEALTSAQLQLPDGASEWLWWTPVGYRPTSYEFSSSFSSASSLDAAYPSGWYTFALETAHDGNQTIPLNLLPQDYPNAPWVSNFAELQTLDANADCVLRWAPFTNTTSADSIVVEIWRDPETRVFATPLAAPLSGTNLSLVIPRNTLAAGHVYPSFLVFTRLTEVDTETYPGTRCAAGYDSYTIFTIRTLPELRLSLSNTTATLSWPKDSGGFALEATADLVTAPQWVSVTNPPIIVADLYTVTLPATNRLMLYRLRKN